MMEKPKPETRIQVPQQIEEHRQCREAPEIPDPKDEQGTAVFILELYAAYEDCRDTLTELNRWLDSARNRAENVDDSDKPEDR